MININMNCIDKSYESIVGNEFFKIDEQGY